MDFQGHQIAQKADSTGLPTALMSSAAMSSAAMSSAPEMVKSMVELKAPR
jgi:hypothetical protein